VLFTKGVDRRVELDANHAARATSKLGAEERRRVRRQVAVRHTGHVEEHVVGVAQGEEQLTRRRRARRVGVREDRTRGGVERAEEVLPASWLPIGETEIAGGFTPVPVSATVTILPFADFRENVDGCGPVVVGVKVTVSVQVWPTARLMPMQPPEATNCGVTAPTTRLHVGRGEVTGRGSARVQES